MPRPKHWSMTFELATIEDAIEGARMLVDLTVNDQAQDDHDARCAPAAASAVLALAKLRLRDVGRVLRGEMDAGQLRAAHNATDEKAADQDVVVRSKDR
jgi:hypothetical protein